MLQLDMVIPVYNEGENILALLDSLRTHVKTPLRVLICFDHDNDTTLPAVAGYPKSDRLELMPVKNEGKGVHGAIMTGFAASQSSAVLVMPADDDYNAPILDAMIAKMEAEQADIVCASRFMPGGCITGCPLLKAGLVRVSSFTLYYCARLPTHDASNGFRLFSRRVITEIPIESQRGFAFSIELLVKAHRRDWTICEVPAQWHERSEGSSRFHVLKWLPTYLRWYFYAFATTWLSRPV